MGLAIEAASHLRFVRPFPPDAPDPVRAIWDAGTETGYRDEDYRLIRPNCPGQEGHLAGTEPGLYIYTPASEKYDFDAGLYRMYNEWREGLSRFALGVEPAVVWDEPGRFASRPFVELINFTDADGRVGARVAAKLAGDFHQLARKAARDKWFFALYKEFAAAFAVAARDGVLEFC
jgi:hypothetical protein